MTPAQIATLAEYGLRPMSEDETRRRLERLFERQLCRCVRRRR